tara:strand:+ start:1060 stop:1272 length:213 start_codon:yes stop_codon:yes gene_type:complete
MKLTKLKLKEIIREELLNEAINVNQFQKKLGDYYLDIIDYADELVDSGVDKKKVNKYIKDFLLNFKKIRG